MTSHTPRASTSASAQGASWPLAPQIDGDAMLQIFIHKSIRYADTSNIPNSPYCDASTLAILGSAILEASYTSILYKENLKADEIEVYNVRRRPSVKSSQNWLSSGIKGYKWREKVRRAVDVDLEQAMEIRFLMDAYVGAVFVGKGFDAVTKWIQALVTLTATTSKASP